MLRLIRIVLLSLIVYIYFIPFAHTNETLIPYTKKVMEIVSKYCSEKQYNNPIHRYIYFSKLGIDDVGQCSLGFRKFTIKIDSKFWRNSSEDERYEVVFHEMYHCLFFKDHVNDPNNYMFYRIANVSQKNVIQQFTDDVKKICLNKGVTNGS